MSDDDLADTLKAALVAPLHALVAGVARSVAEGQLALDRSTIAAYQAIHAEELDSRLRSLRALGYQPTWYQIPETEVELRLAITLSRQVGDSGGDGGVSEAILATPIDAEYVNRYAYRVDGSSRLRFKIVAVPPSLHAEGMRIVPRVGGLVSEALAILDAAGVPHVLSPATKPPEHATVTSVMPAPGEILATGQAVTIKWQPSES